MKKLAKEEVLRIVRDLHTRLDVIYGERLKGVYLFGSYARGDARDESDIDVAVVLAGEVDSWNELELTEAVISEICLKENTLILTMFLSEKEFNEQPFDFHRNLAAEGISV